MRLTYDQDADAAYIYLEEISPGEAKQTVPWGEGELRELFLDLNSDGMIIGIEIVDASRVLSAHVLEGRS